MCTWVDGLGLVVHGSVFGCMYNAGGNNLPSLRKAKASHGRSN